MENKNRPSEKKMEMIKIFVSSKIATDKDVKVLLQKLYKGNEVFETAIAQNGTRLISFEIYGNLSSRSNSVILHELLQNIIKLEGSVQFISTDNTLFKLDDICNTTELSSTTFKASDYNAKTNTK
ncbi:hypothetical protein [Staphylococcus xylosus]|uniref:hypothetical protein n=1 Tax=Staphylococcus xylosus TaxID=1288 RepID=UPI003F54C981